MALSGPVNAPERLPFATGLCDPDHMLNKDLAVCQGSKWCLDHAAGRQAPAKGQEQLHNSHSEPDPHGARLLCLCLTRITSRQ